MAQAAAQPVFCRSVRTRSSVCRAPALRAPSQSRSVLAAAVPERLERLSREWLQQECNESSKREIERLIAVEDEVELTDRLGQRLQFGEWVCRRHPPACRLCRRCSSATAHLSAAVLPGCCCCRHRGPAGPDGVGVQQDERCHNPADNAGPAALPAAAGAGAAAAARCCHRLRRPPRVPRVCHHCCGSVRQPGHPRVALQRAGAHAFCARRGAAAGEQGSELLLCAVCRAAATAAAAATATQAAMRPCRAARRA